MNAYFIWIGLGKVPNQCQVFRFTKYRNQLLSGQSLRNDSTGNQYQFCRFSLRKGRRSAWNKSKCVCSALDPSKSNE